MAAAAKKILFIVTSHDQLGKPGDKPIGKTGWYLPEVAHPYQVLTKAGYHITFVSPKGGKAPMDPGSGEAFATDQICKDFLANESAMSSINKTKKPSEVKASDFKAIFYPGGHGPMYDISDNEDIAKLGVAIYQAGGIVSAVCHGPVGLIPLKLQNKEYLIKGKKVTCFTNAEEAAVNLTKAMPFLLETKLKEQGGIFKAAEKNFDPYVEVDGRLVTGQNPASATMVADEVLKLLQKKTVSI